MPAAAGRLSYPRTASPAAAPASTSSCAAPARPRTAPPAAGRRPRRGALRPPPEGDRRPPLLQPVRESGGRFLHGGRGRRDYGLQSEEAVDHAVVAAGSGFDAGLLQGVGVGLALVAQRV